MHKQGDEIHVDDTEASGGSKEGVVRWVLAAGTLLAIILLSLIWMTGALTQGDREEEIVVPGGEQGAQVEASDEASDAYEDSLIEDAADIENAPEAPPQ